MKSKNLFLGFLFTLLILVSITAISAADTNTTGTQTGVQTVNTQTAEPAEKAVSAQVTKTRENDNKIKTTINEKEITKNTTTNIKTVKTTTKSLKQETDGTFTQLQQAIDDETGGTLTLTQGYTRGTDESVITINKTITIDGKGYTLNANGTRGVFNITGGNVILQNMTITNSTGGSAITIQSGANVTENNINATNNNATEYNGVNYGGVNYNNGTLTITGGTFTNNNARYGGLNYNKGTLTITGGTFTNNTAYYGGVNYNINGILTINKGTFTNNTAKYYGGVNYNINGILTINKGTFTNNTAEYYGGVNYNYQGNLTINGGRFTNNKATQGGGVNYNFYGTLTINNGTFTNSNASSGGVNYNKQGTLTINNGTFTNNNASYGGVNDNEGNLTINNGNYTSNKATQNGGVNYNLGNLTINNSTFTNNTAKSRGGVNYNYGNLTIKNATFTNNTGKLIIYSERSFTVENSLFINNSCNNTLFYENINIKYIQSITNNTYTGNNLTTTMNITPDTITSGGELNLQVTVKPHNIYNTTITTGNITIYEDNEKIKTVPVNDGTASIPYTPHAGEYNLTATYTDLTNSYTTTNKTILINLRALTKVEAEILNNTATNNTIQVTVTDTQNNTVTVGNITITDEKGQVVGNGSVDETGTATITTNLNKKGTYNLTVTYLENENYSSGNTVLKDMEITGKKAQIKADVINNTAGNTTIEISIIDPVTNTFIPDAHINITLPDGTNMTENTGETGTVEIPLDLPAGENNITVIYLGNDVYNKTDTLVPVNIIKVDAVITVEPVKGIIGENITLTAYITDIYGNNIIGGNIVFKLNGITLREDGTFAPEGQPLKLSVKNGTVTYTLTDMDTIKKAAFLKTALNITASYSGSNNYNSAVAKTQDAQINLRTAQITITTDQTLVKQNSNITITATVKDTTNTGNSYVNNGKIIFKINGKTVKDEEGNIRIADVNNSTATIKYTIPRGTSSANTTANPKNYTITANYINKIQSQNKTTYTSGTDIYNYTINTTTYNVEKSPVNINITNVSFYNDINKTQISIKANMTDYQGNNIAGKSKIAIKINGITLKDENNKTKFFEITDGTIDLNNITIPKQNSYSNITVVAGERYAYEKAETTTQLPLQN